MAGDVAADYVHRDKLAIPRVGLVIQRSHLKWTNIALPETPVPTEINRHR